MGAAILIGSSVKEKLATDLVLGRENKNRFIQPFSWRKLSDSVVRALSRHGPVEERNLSGLEVVALWNYAAVQCGTTSPRFTRAT